MSSIRVLCPNPRCAASIEVIGDDAGPSTCPMCRTPFPTTPRNAVVPVTQTPLSPSPGQAPTPLTSKDNPIQGFEPGTMLKGHLKIIGELGRGGMAVVLLAINERLNRYEAIKLPFLSQDTRVLRRFIGEARIAAGLEHPHICQIYDDGEVNGRPFIRMAYIRGSSLEDQLKNRAALFDPREAAEIVRLVALALQHAHERNIIHRDLKPANIMMRNERHPVVMDFGIAKDVDSGGHSSTIPGQLLGTPAYMAIEQFDTTDPNFKPTPRCDIYSLGVILYRMLTGKMPFRGKDHYQFMAALFEYRLERPTAIVEGLDLALEAICLKAMARDANDRYASMYQLAEALDAYLKKAPTTPKPPKPPKTPNWLVKLFSEMFKGVPRVEPPTPNSSVQDARLSRLRGSMGFTSGMS